MLKLNTFLIILTLISISISVYQGFLLNKLQNSKKIGINAEVNIANFLILSGFISIIVFSNIILFIILTSMGIVIYTFTLLDSLFRRVSNRIIKKLLQLLSVIPVILLLLKYNNNYGDKILILYWAFIVIMSLIIILITVLQKSGFLHLLNIIPLVLFPLPGLIDSNLQLLGQSLFFTLLVLIFLFLAIVYIKEVSLEIIYKKNNFDALNKYKLTFREKQIALLLISGKKYKDISESLNISLKTVNAHVSNIYKKCNINNRSALMRILY